MNPLKYIINCYSSKLQRQINVERVFFTINDVGTIGSAILLIGICAKNKNICSQKTCTWMLVGALYITAKNIAITKCLSTGEWLNKLFYIHIWLSGKMEGTIDTYTTWMILKSLMLSKRSQTQKITHCMIPFMWHCGKGKTIGT